MTASCPCADPVRLQQRRPATRREFHHESLPLRACRCRRIRRLWVPRSATVARSSRCGVWPRATRAGNWRWLAEDREPETRHTWPPMERGPVSSSRDRCRSKRGRRPGARTLGSGGARRSIRSEAARPLRLPITGGVDGIRPRLWTYATGSRLQDPNPILPGGGPAKRRRPESPPPTPATARATPIADSIIYEMHVKGYTQLHPSVPEISAAPTPALPTQRSSPT